MDNALGAWWLRHSRPDLADERLIRQLRQLLSTPDLPEDDGGFIPSDPGAPMTDTAVPDDVTAAVSIVAMKIISDHVREWSDTLNELVFVPLEFFQKIGDENWRLVLRAIATAAGTMQPESKLVDAAMLTLQEAVQNAAAATKGVD